MYSVHISINAVVIQFSKINYYKYKVMMLGGLGSSNFLLLILFPVSLFFCCF